MMRSIARYAVRRATYDLTRHAVRNTDGATFTAVVSGAMAIGVAVTLVLLVPLLAPVSVLLAIGGVGHAVTAATRRGKGPVQQQYTDDEVRLHQAAARLIGRTDGARNLEDVGRLTGQSWADLLATEAGLDRAVVRRITGA